MTTVQITLPDELAQKAANEGLLSAHAIEAMLREQLRRRAGDALQAAGRCGWCSTPTWPSPACSGAGRRAA